MSMLLGVFICVLIQGLFSGTEGAFVYSNKMRMRHLADEGDERARWVLELLDKPDRLFGTTLVGVNLSVVLGSIFMTQWLGTNPRLEEYDFIISTVIMTPLLLFLGEILPMSIFQQYSSLLSRLMIVPLRVAWYVLYPFTVTTSLFSSSITRMLGLEFKEQGFANREELRLMITQGSEAEKQFEDDSDILEEIFEFSQTTARNVMVPLIDVVAVPVTATVAEVVDTIRDSHHSRIPVYEDRIDNIVGIVRAPDLVTFGDSTPVARAMYRPYFIPDVKFIEEVLADFRINQKRMGIVVNEFGGCAGIVTIEDIVEELVGEITDEYGVGVEAEARVVGETLEVEGKMRISDLNEEFELGIPEGEYESLAGFIIRHLNRIPARGEIMKFRGRDYQVLESTDRRIEKVAIRRSKPPSKRKISGK